jgi:glycine/D-amino acid oxidase-like deaminating enzyme
VADRNTIAVIGAGVVGASVSYHLSREGASFAWVNASAKAGHDEYFELNYAGLKEYLRLTSELTDATWWHQTGHLRWDYADAQTLRSAVEQLVSRGYPAETWDADRARRLLEPNVELVSPSGLVAVLPAEGWVDGALMANALTGAAVAEGAATAFGRKVCAIAIEDGAVAAVELAGGERRAVAAVVNAAGPAADAIAALIGRTLPMKDSRGLVVRLATEDGPVRHVLHAPGIGIRPDGPGRTLLLTHSVEPELSAGRHAPRELVERVLARGADVVPALRGAMVTDARVGQRPIPIDDLPAVGPAGGVRGYYEAVMHSGITLGPLVGRALAAEVVHGQIDRLVGNFRASRFHGGEQPSAAFLTPR